MSTTMAPFPDVAFTDGPTLDDPGLRGQLAASSGRLLRLPVVVEFDDEYRLAVRRAWLGTGAADPAPSALQLKLDDTSMGVSLLDSLRAACPPGPRCAVLVDATWGPVLSGMPALPSVGPARDTVAVRRFVGLQPVGTPARVRVEG